MKPSILFIALLSAAPFAQADKVSDRAAELEPQVIEWRRHFHQYPELSNREFETAKYIEKYLRSLGLPVQTGVAKTGVVAVLDTGKPGPTIALRADMDGLPVPEQNELPFRSEAIGEYNGNEVPVMHACGHDTHMAMLMGAAKILTEMKSELTGKIKFVFQPAEEGAPAGEEGGAELMVKEGVMKDVDVIFGLHISSDTDVGVVEYRHGGIMAAVDPFKIVVRGKQAHGAYPWLSVDPITTAAQIVMGLQTIVSRELPLTEDAAVVTIGSIHGGNRSNIIPNEVELVGTIRTLNQDMRDQLHQAVHRKATSIAESMRAEAEVTLPLDYSYPVTYNDPALMDKMLPTLHRTAGEGKVKEVKAVTGAEDFSFFQQEVPGVYLFVGGKPLDLPREQAPAHHTPEFKIDEAGMKLGVELLTNLTLDYMKSEE
ncbi:amidohydrolase [Lacimicrobium alkaliphilum]|uniref:N-acyl-L-amino acid amidohydrolase n=1 Tax=Lacimicrobium alkaliphilum TaxID=1526571 RepID=A0A0U3AVG7_9ALTE|nr:amidohydrolase [Lacimicrobium alkaliphilum]ALS96936.1 N-acyl-L-amino acid amidohydrolase [Lacimicrobium alkaliphilum]